MVKHDVGGRGVSARTRARTSAAEIFALRLDHGKKFVGFALGTELFEPRNRVLVPSTNPLRPVRDT